MSLFAAPETVPFGIAVVIILVIALLEGLGMLLAFSPSNLLDHILPHLHVHLPDAHAEADRALGWLHQGKVPLLVLVVIFLGGYAVFGYVLQMAAHGLIGTYLPAWLAGLVAVPAGLGTVRGIGAMVGHILPGDESSAISEQTLIGRAGVVCSGSARRGLAAQARVRDSRGRAHYLMVEPDVDGEVFEEGAQVLIVRKVGAFYRCIANPHPALL